MIRLLFDLGKHFLLSVVDVDLGPVVYFKEDLYEVETGALPHKYEYILGVVAETNFISGERLSCQHLKLNKIKNKVREGKEILTGGNS